MRRGLVLGTGLLGSSTSAVATGATTRTAWQLRVDVQQPADLLLVVATGVLALLLCRLTGFTVAVVAAAAAPRSTRVRGLATALSPRLLRPVVIAVLGMGIGLSGAAAASASTAVGTGPLTTSVSVGWEGGGASASDVADPRPVVNPGWVAPTPRTPTTASADVHLVSSGRAAAQPDGTVVVRRGDCLWTLAARQLGDHAGDAQVSEQWHRWWAVNRATIGDDPDLLVPGTRLVVPSTTAGGR
ncbi:LysM peptidoglycan-binding domain-containing protein [Angustibacter luteus]|uniref:LysM peptidoglycan-binding domain-containing protein n=1 Tax=Angustibacter luteus TaxID=658456 RepID=A0ABW1JG16_9ACTN